MPNFTDSTSDLGLDLDLGFDDLDALLEESMTAAKAKETHKANRKRLQVSNLSKDEKDALESQVKLYELQKEWKAEANVAMFNVQACRCGSKHAVFSGWFQRQRSRQSKVDRWVRPEAGPSPALANERLDIDLPDTSICQTCAPAQGYFLAHTPTESNNTCPLQPLPVSNSTPRLPNSTNSQEAPQNTGQTVSPEPQLSGISTLGATTTGDNFFEQSQTQAASQSTLETGAEQNLGFGI